jgi:hypothetical protein
MKTTNDLGEMKAPINDEGNKEKQCQKNLFISSRNYVQERILSRFLPGKMRYCEDYDFYFRIMTDDLKMANLDECLWNTGFFKTLSREQDKSSKIFSSINLKFFTKND